MTPPSKSINRGAAVPATGQTFRAALEAWPDAAFVIEPHTAVLVAANGAGQSMFPALEAGHPITLDGAMPAVKTLREVARGGASAAEGVPLFFWTAGGARSLTCSVERAVDDAGAPLLLVKAVTGADLAAGPAPAAAAATGREIPPRTGEDQAEARAASPGAPEPVAERAPAPPADVPKGIDLAKLAHELKTPVSAIAAASEIMKEGRFGPIGNERYAGYIADIHASAQYALVLIERMLNRAGEGATSRPLPLKLERLALDEIAAACLSSVRPLAEAKRLKVETQKSKTPVPVMGDVTAVRQIVLNLVANAIKFTPAGGAITLATSRSKQGGAVLTVSDTGPGMTAGAIAEVFTPVAGDPSDVLRVREGGGLGLGLPMARALAEAMGAVLAIGSAPKGGTRVTITFPGGPRMAL